MKAIITLLALTSLAVLSSCTAYVDDGVVDKTTTTTTTRSESAYIPGGAVQETTRTTRTYD